ncbi:MAG: VOC family protein [Solirubrobacteraceae bacterium]|nr:VOC family protein [Solirubrobacteraceae bacterium]
MQLQGLHHITMITADAQRTVDFYAGLLGLRMVKKTVNFDAPEAYHLYFGDEAGSPGSILTWFAFPDAAQGQAGAGMIHRLQLAVATTPALEFWLRRLEAAGVATQRSAAPAAVQFTDPDGLSLELVVAEDVAAPLRAVHPDVPEEHAIVGLAGARAYAGAELAADASLLVDTLGFTALGAGTYRLDGGSSRFDWAYDHPPGRGIQGAGTVHHIAWHSSDEDHEGWRERVHGAGLYVTDVIDRDYFHAIYFRQPQGILFEIATTSPGFAVDEDPAHLGEGLRLPKQHEHLREELERTLPPVVNPRTGHTEPAPVPLLDPDEPVVVAAPDASSLPDDPFPPDEPDASAPPRPPLELRVVRNRLLDVHRRLLQTQQLEVEHATGRKMSPHEVLAAAMGDPRFSWLRELSALITQIDEAVADKDGDPATARALGDRVRSLVGPPNPATDFGARYLRAMQTNPDVILAHRDLSALL